MLSAKINELYVFGLDAENIKRLLQKQPIIVPLSNLGGTGSVVIMAAPTMDEVIKDVEEALGFSLPEPQTILDEVKQ
ncbi:MAG: hypothetical protein PHQ40_15640 [Anaerolineaceae bacterium]|nr:hypothetical protein [Anaerolineaceae bacterium]